MNGGNVFLYGMYAVTVVLGIALVLWLLRSRRASVQHSAQVAKARVRAKGEDPTTIKAVRGISASTTMAEALAGVQFPLHWQPDPPSEVQSPFTLTTSQDTAGAMAEKLTSELARLGYRISPTGAASAQAIRGDSQLNIQVESDKEASFVSARIALTETARG